MKLSEEVELFVKGLGKVPAQVVETFKVLCERTGLSPIARQIYLIERGGKWQAQTSIDGFRSIAARSPSYKGQDGPYWTMGPGDPWTDIPPSDTPYAAKVGIYIDGAPKPTYATAKYADYAAGPMWKKFPSTMIAKCAEALALRKALPAEMSGLYTAEEMEQADKSKTKEKRASGRGLEVETAFPDSRDETQEDVPFAAELEAQIALAANLDFLKSLKPRLMKLPKEEQARLSPIYSARTKALKEQA